MAQAVNPLSESRFAGISKLHAALILALLAVAVIVSAWNPVPTGPVTTATTGALVLDKSKGPSTADDEDLVLYRTINKRIANGEPYYPVTAHELRVGNYPLRPFITFRFPTLAYVQASLGPTLSIGLLWILALATLAVWWTRLDGVFANPRRRLTGLLLVCAGCAIVARGHYYVMHELTAGLLLATALALYRPDRWLPSVLVAALALLVRELALPFILLMGAFALYHRRWREFGAWSIVIIAFAGLLYLHAQQVAAVTTPTDPASQGWAKMGGWSAFIRTYAMTSALRIMPDALSAAGVVLALFGWFSWRSETGLFGALLFSGYGLFFMLFGRPENFYWGMLLAPAFILGLAFLPRALADLAAAFTAKQPQLDSAAA